MRAWTLGLEVEVFSNLVHVPEAHWELYRREGVSLATSYYSDQAGEHNAMTGRPSHARTRAIIAKAVRLGIPLRAGIIVASDNQRATEARADLESLGVTRIGVDRIREFGRGSVGEAPDAANLCGRCGDGRAAIGPDGRVSPCVFSTWMGVGNVRRSPLVSVLTSKAMAEANSAIRRVAGEGDCQPQCYPNQTPCYPANTPCAPKGDFPEACNPDDEECGPGVPSIECRPRR
ncbi:SPASM domain-containing protein [Streptomyces sp. PT12]|uniref:SPASM domain-containing protein n=1 Tax=Streptomyces sp. PT12 TaxID=1510197 RepID=UPI000DE269DF|nr:SPASM domain-containing protein [Streptomyces sp. PT12]RBM23315.1 radical SAM protein [Streptomyces sp. PT12]